MDFKLYLNPPANANKLGIVEVPIKIRCNINNDCTPLENFETVENFYSVKEENIINAQINNITNLIKEINSSVSSIKNKIDNYKQTYKSQKQKLENSVANRNKQIEDFIALFIPKTQESFENMSNELNDTKIIKKNLKLKRANFILIK